MSTIQTEIQEQLDRTKSRLIGTKQLVETLEEEVEHLRKALDCDHNDWECLGGSLLVEERCTECGYTRFV